MSQREQCFGFYLGNGRSYEGFALPRQDLLPVAPSLPYARAAGAPRAPHRDRIILLSGKLKVRSETSNLLYHCLDCADANLKHFFNVLVRCRAKLGTHLRTEGGSVTTG